MSQNVPDNEQGLLQGTMSSVNTVAMIVGPLIATGIFAKSVGENAWFAQPGTYYFFGAFLFVVTLSIIVLDTRRRRLAKVGRH